MKVIGQETRTLPVDVSPREVLAAIRAELLQKLRGEDEALAEANPDLSKDAWCGWTTDYHNSKPYILRPMTERERALFEAVDQIARELTGAPFDRD